MTDRTGQRRISRRASTLVWAGVVVALVLVVPVLRFLLGGGLRPQAKPAVRASSTVRDLGRPWRAEEIARYSYGSGDSRLAGVEDAALDVNTRLDVVLPAPDGGQLVIDRPEDLKGIGRARRFDADGNVTGRFQVPFGSTLFTLDGKGDLWFDLASGSGTIETVVHVDRTGKEVRRYPLPDKLRARFLQVSAEGDVYAFTEEWIVDMKRQEATYEPSLIPVALGPELRPPADAVKERVEGSFFDAEGRLYRVTGTAKIQSAEVPRFGAEALDESGSVIARYRLPKGFKPVCALADGTLLSAELAGSPASAPGASSLGDPVADQIEMLAVSPDGVTDAFRVSPPRYVSNWAPPVVIAPDGRVQLTAARGGDLAVLRLSPGAERSATASATAGKPGLSVLFPGEPFSGDPYAASDVAVRDLFTLVYGGLVRFDADLTAVPDIAAQVPSVANGGVSRDGRVVTYRIRPGLQWHDGTPVTGEDVAATWRYLRSPHPEERPRPFPGFDSIESVEAKGDIVVVRLSEPFGAAPETFFPYVLPAHLLTTGTAGFLSAPVGSGPYRLVRWETGAKWALEAADGPRKPRLARTDILFESGGAARETLTTSGGPLLWSWMPQEQVDLARRDGVGALTWAPTGRVWLFALNANDPVLRDARTRRALVSAYPLARLRSGVLPSEGATGAVPLFGRSNGVKARTDDTSAALSLLEDAGWSGGGAVRTRGETTLSVLVGVTQRESADEVTIEQLREMIAAWQPLGVAAEREVGRARFYGSWWQGGYLTFQDWQTAVGVFPALPDPAWGGLFDPADTPSRDDPLGLNVTRTADERLRDLFEQARSEPEAAVRARLGTEIAERVAQLGLALPERREVRWTGRVGDLEGYAPAPYPAGEFWNVETWSTAGEGR